MEKVAYRYFILLTHKTNWLNPRVEKKILTFLDRKSDFDPKNSKFCTIFGTF